MVVVVDVIMHARFERINAIGSFETEVLGFQGAEEAFDHRVVKVGALAAHALLDSASHEHRSVVLHLVVLTLVGMHDQACDAVGISHQHRLDAFTASWSAAHALSTFWHAVDPSSSVDATSSWRTCQVARASRVTRYQLGVSDAIFKGGLPVTNAAHAFMTSRRCSSKSVRW